MKKMVLWITLILFSLITLFAVMEYGVVGIIQYQLANWAGVQVLVDLIIALAFFLVWMWQDAKKRGISPWPWLILTLLIGSFGPLIYFIVRCHTAKND